jgi:UPF0042 nucleotide-binding protein
MNAPSETPVETESAARAGGARVLLVTGMSGAGRSSALKVLEDLGYEAVDNLPLSLLPRLLAAPGAALRPLALGVDIRTRDFAVPPLLAEIDGLVRSGRWDTKLLFLDCDDEILARRFTETRRRHPLAGDRAVLDGIALERARVSLLRSRADIVIDTSLLRPAELKRVLQGYFEVSPQALSIFITSFAYREGLPREADLVFDVRFLDNPHYDPLLRPLSGLDREIQEYVARDPDFAGFVAALRQLLLPLLPRFDREGKSYLTIAIGCTGGRHRSVYVAELLAELFRGEGVAVNVAHRDIDRSPLAAVEAPSVDGTGVA